MEEDSSPQRDGRSTTSGFKIGPYEKPQIPTHAPSIALVSNAMSPVPGNGMASPAIANPSLGGVGTASGGNVPSGNAPNQLLVGKNVNQVWGRKMEPVPPPAPTAPEPSVVNNPPTRSGSISSLPTQQQAQPQYPGGNVASQQGASVAVVAPAAPRQPTEKEKMAAGLFGGINSGASSKSSNTMQRRKSSNTSNVLDNTPEASSLNTPSKVASTTTASPPAPVVAVSNFDLLDMATSPPPPTGSVTQPAVGYSVHDFGDVTVNRQVAQDHSTGTIAMTSSPVAQHVTPAKTSTVFDAFADMSMGNTDVPLQPLQPLQPTNMAPVVPLANVYDNLYAKPVPSYRPVRLTTAEFGTRWGNIPAEMKSMTRLSPNIRNLEALRMCIVQGDKIGHVDSIVNTNEAIFAATLTSSIVAPMAPLGSLLLVHIKLFLQKGEVSVTGKK